ncbi:hypothetical protein CKAH01_16229 [Colletotrichum kahawae]|uniref:Integrase catalytic domain-containing protein n=1 Tax=Colletotrichum kahawae TaxID=34407 RepID=A0AAE0D751_COLKA|nr:hypothetical protein CKAH01_16229 [Colletotrichum kahawae]
MTSKRYALHFLDKYSGYHWLVLLLNHHYEVMRDAIKNFHDVFNNMTGLNVKTWVCDNALEFKKVLSDPCFANTYVNYTIANTPSMNGSIERIGRTIIEAACTQLVDANLPEELWDYSLDSTVQVLNLLPQDTKDLWIQRSMTTGISDSPEKSLEISAMTPASSNTGDNALDTAMEGLDLITLPPDEIMLRSTSQSPLEDNTVATNHDENANDGLMETKLTSPLETIRPPLPDPAKVTLSLLVTISSSLASAAITRRPAAISRVLPQGYSIPKTFKQAKDNPHWPEWKKACL